jgi:hypothetical protein
MLQYSAIFNCYSAQSFLFAIVLNNSSLLQCSTIHHCYNAQPFIAATVLNPFLAIVNSCILLQCSTILWFCQPFSRFYQSFCYRLSNFTKLFGHSRDSVSHFLKWLTRVQAHGVGARLGRGRMTPSGWLAARLRARGWELAHRLVGRGHAWVRGSVARVGRSAMRGRAWLSQTVAG